MNLLSLIAMLSVSFDAGVPVVPNQRGSATTGRFDPTTNELFGPVEPAAKRLLERQAPVPTAPQHFCVVGSLFENEPVVWVHWREAKRLVLWGGSDDADGRANGLVKSSRRWRPAFLSMTQTRL